MIGQSEKSGIEIGSEYQLMGHPVYTVHMSQQLHVYCRIYIYGGHYFFFAYRVKQINGQARIFWAEN